MVPKATQKIESGVLEETDILSLLTVLWIAASFLLKTQLTIELKVINESDKFYFGDNWENFVKSCGSLI